jgi:DNA-binding winged helix-turn-helix (wHTH) protein/Tol biopolymer transport system component
MAGVTTSSRFVHFDTFEVDLRSGELRNHGSKISLQPQPFQILAILLEHPGELVTREEIRQRLWSSDTFVDFEHSLNTSIKKLREALGEHDGGPRYIETLPRHGYRLICKVERIEVRSPSSKRRRSRRAKTVEAGPSVVPLPHQSYDSPGEGHPNEAALNPAPMETQPRSGDSPGEDRQKGTPLSDGHYSKHWRPFLVAGIMAALIIGPSIARLATRSRPGSPPELKQRRLIFNPSENAVNQGAISPDGRYLAYGDRKGLHLRLIEAGETRSLLQPEGPAPDRGEWRPNGWFPDGTRFVATRLEPGGHTSAWVTSVTGGEPRRISGDAAAWSVAPDGSLIALGTQAASAGGFREIWLTGPQGEDPRRFVTAAADEELFWAAWSPDGGRIAYGKHRRVPDRVECSIESRDLNGGQPAVLLSEPRLCAGSAGFVWSPDGRFIYAMSEPEPNQNESNVWETRVDARTGKPLGKPTRITNWPGVRVGHLSESADGKRLVVSKWGLQTDVYIGELEANGRRLKDLRRLTLDESNDHPSAWTLDSKAVLFSSDRNGSVDIFRQAIGQNSAELVATGPDYKDEAVVSPDGSWILYLSRATARFVAASRVRIMRVPTSGGAPQIVLEGRGIARQSCGRFPGSPCVFSEETLDQKQLVFSTFDPLQGRGREIARVNLDRPPAYPTDNPTYDWDLSPDGSRLALALWDPIGSRIQIIPVAGGEAHEVILKSSVGLSGVS